MILGRLNVSRRILLVLLIGVATPAFLSVQSLMKSRDALLDARASEVRHLDESAWTVVAAYQARAAQGLMTVEAAKDAAKSAVRSMRYDGTNYFFIWDLAGTGIAHGGNPAVEGKNFLTGADAANNPGVADMVGKLVAVARDHGEGFARYKIPKAGQTIPLDKIGYSKLFEPWGWTIGTGAYVSDIDAVFWAKAQSDLIVAACLTFVAGLISYVLGRDLSRALRRLTGAMKQLADGDLDTPIPAVMRRDEVGVMAATVRIFRDNAVKTRELEKEKSEAQSRRAAEDDRVRHEAEQKAAAEAAALVVDSIGAGLERLAAGDLTYRILTTLPSPYEQLRGNLNETVAHLGDLVRGILASASEIRSGTGQISTAADDLSRRTEQQAASLEETAAALDEITATVKKTSDGSVHARTAVGSAKADAERSGIVVGQAVEAMSAIEQSAHKISQIIGVIDEIAFQTNLLALNAGVEAARAGEAGRGFAVVASEVRALAQRSAEAAREIKALISTSSQQVSTGVDLVNETGAALKRIVMQVAQINAVVSDIATSTQEQATALQEVNTAINQMDQVTQQNAAMVEETTAASKSLVQETEELARLIGQFQLDATITGPDARSGQTRANPATMTTTALKTRGNGGAARKPEISEQSWEQF